MSAASAPEDTAVMPWRGWWGLAGCAAFMALVLVAGPYSDGFSIAPDKGDFWYYWQRSDATAWSRLSAWLPYCLHQGAIWYLIAAARRERPRYVRGLHRFNVLALGVNAFFMVLHVVQTRLFYDGLAQDVHEATSFGSVALMLFMILVMENQRRGMVFGRPLPLMQTAGDALRRYHGFFFSWAIIYTFWYHPVELTGGHIAGFAYMSLLLLQSSLFFTRFHVNRVWTATLEFLWCVHGAIIAAFILQEGQMQFWSSFLFGGLAVFLITQLHGLGLTLRGKLLVAAPIVAAMTTFYAVYPEALSSLPKQPMVLYGGAIVMAAVIFVLARLGGVLAGLARRDHAAARP
jgi:hypothetical protein